VLEPCEADPLDCGIKNCCGAGACTLPQDGQGRLFLSASYRRCITGTHSGTAVAPAGLAIHNAT
jgi:hypothetical protein